MSNRIYYKTTEEVALIRESSLIVSKTLAEVAKVIKPGINLLALDKLAEEFIRDNGGVPAFKGYGGFPNSLCISPNEQVVHGIPTSREVKEGDCISVDCGVLKNGFYGDSAFTFGIGPITASAEALLNETIQSLYAAIDKAVVGNRLGDISYAVQEHAQKHNYGIVRELVGHGIGMSLHEKPEVPNYGKRGAGIKLEEGLVIAIEPMINMGTAKIVNHKDGWTITTADNKLSAHYEHTVCIGKEKAEVLSSFACIEEAMMQNANCFKLKGISKY